MSVFLIYLNEFHESGLVKTICNLFLCADVINNDVLAKNMIMEME